jgi:murein DD-endopeptidase MepM/ murein hydrolase activator NlpD
VPYSAPFIAPAPVTTTIKLQGDLSVKFIFISHKRGRSYSVTLGLWAKALLALCGVGLPCGVAALLVLNFAQVSRLLNQHEATWSDSRNTSLEARNQQAKVNALAMRVAELQAKLMRLDALGERISSKSQLDLNEFDFSRTPGVGGPQSEQAPRIFELSELNALVDHLSARLEGRQHQLEYLDEWVSQQKFDNEALVAGAPVKDGFRSSEFGWRSDPFTGQSEMHEGVDFSAPEGSEIMAVASGLITWSADKTGYGNLVEINHGNGFKTRYGHCKKNLVHIGDMVQKGQVIALLGNTGRSSGPHVHFEVYKNNRVVDPASYIRTTVP